jgi:hypothetical protein
MHEFENSVALPRMWMSPNYKDPALEAAHGENERLQRVIVLQQLLLDEATTRIGELAQYQHKAGTVIAHLYAKIRALRKQNRRDRHSTKNAGLAIVDVRGEHLGLRQAGVAPSNQGANRAEDIDFFREPAVPVSYSSRVATKSA